MADGSRRSGLAAILALALLPLDASALVNQFGAPTLVYNCAKMPSICTNVHARNPLQFVGTSSSGVAVNRNLGRLDAGQTPGGLDHLNLQFDTSDTNKGVRRGQSCPDNWAKNHACPETNQPRTIPQGSSWSYGGYDAVAYNRAQNIANGQNGGSPGFNQIADPAGNNPSGMIWSCDEWPPATFTNGGAGASTYCAPWAQKCVSTATGGTTPAVQTEQNFQGLSHGALRRRVSDASTNPTGVWDFKFQTMWHDDASAVAASVSYNFAMNAEAGETIAKRWFSPRKRSFGPTHVGTEMFFSNGTRAHIFRPVTPEEHAENVRAGISGTYAAHSPAKQLFGELSIAPPLPIVDITRNFIRESAKLPVIPYVERVLRTLSTPLKVPGGLSFARARRSRNYVSTFDTSIFSPFDKRAGAGGCSASNPCPDGSCCNKKGLCGYGSENCGAGNCVSNCNATALCGKDSAGGSVKCPLNVCCSYYGYCGTDSDYCTSPNPDAPCQKGFGSCSTVSAPSCGGSSSSGRSIAYYQVANVRERQCNRITPAQINTAGLTHLNLAFASIDPSSFQVVPGDAADVAIYSNFTALKSSTLQTWIAIGGWDFSDPGPTRTTWSDMASSSANRAAFISSLKSFMAKYGFQGVDLDWEYPGAPDRAGKPGDTQNFVRLVKEMRASFGSSYGISATLPSSYWYMRWFDPISMQPYVDFFGVMTYDLHGPWDKNVRSIGPTVLGQTNVAEIFNWTLPLWYDGVDPAKLNMGLAYYGRGYTLADPNCNTPGCKWSGPSRPAPCTNFPGVMSLQEIQNLLPQVGVSPTLDSTAMMKYLTYSDQWIGYDDLQTIGRKKAWANSHCWGGTMIWSIDLFSGAGSGNTPDGGGSSNPSDPGSGDGQGGSSGGNSSGIVYIDPSIWSDPHPTIQCQPPCTFILPPYTLAKPTTISIPPLTTSLDVAWSESTGWTSITQTTVISIPPVTTTAIEIWQYTVTDSTSVSGVSSTFYPTISVRPPPFTITDNPNPLSKSGVSHSKVTRTITPPPWPYSFVSPSRVLTASPTSSSSTTVAILPIVTYKPGKPGPICHVGCGKPCIFFCSHPCLLDCSDGGNDFPDPSNPKPPKKPTGKTPDDPDPTGKPVPPEGDPEGDEPEDPEEEDEDRACALEFGLPVPKYTGTIGQANQGGTTTKGTGGGGVTTTKQTSTKTTSGGGGAGPTGSPSTGSKILYVTYCSSGSSFDSCNKYFSLFKDTTDFCSQPSPFYAEQAPPNSKGFATSMGPFDVVGHSNCKYYGDGGAGAGYFKCQDGKTSICKDISNNSSLNEKCSSSGFNYKGYAECHYD